jgi:hypothetical protein
MFQVSIFGQQTSKQEEVLKLYSLYFVRNVCALLELLTTVILMFTAVREHAVPSFERQIKLATSSCALSNHRSNGDERIQNVRRRNKIGNVRITQHCGEFT